MKATIMTEKGPVILNENYLNSVGKNYTYFYVPNEAVNAELFRSVGEAITNISKNEDEWQVQVATSAIKWED